MYWRCVFHTVPGRTQPWSFPILSCCQLQYIIRQNKLDGAPNWSISFIEWKRTRLHKYVESKVAGKEYLPPPIRNIDKNATITTLRIKGVEWRLMSSPFAWICDFFHRMTLADYNQFYVYGGNCILLLKPFAIPNFPMSSITRTFSGAACGVTRCQLGNLLWIYDSGVVADDDDAIQ